MFVSLFIIALFNRILIFVLLSESFLVNLLYCLLTVQKKGMRAVMPGCLRYFDEDEILPTHTKSAFKEYKIMTVQSIIVKNKLIFTGKVLRFSSEIPLSIRNLIPLNLPSHSPPIPRSNRRMVRRIRHCTV